MSDLVRMVSDASEDFWCAGWLTSAEYELWARVQQYRRTGKCTPWGLASWEATVEVVRELSDLSAASGEWVKWDPDAGPVTLPVDQWIMGDWVKADPYFVELAVAEPECGALGPMVPYKDLTFPYFSRCHEPAGHEDACVYLDSDGLVVVEPDTPTS